MNEWDEGWACYSAGPMLEIDSDRIEQHDVIARYVDVPGEPIAIAGRQIGRGLALATGIVPEIGGKRMFEQLDPNSIYLKDGQKFVNALYMREDSRKRIWDTVIHKILLNAAKNGRAVPLSSQPDKWQEFNIP